MDAGFLDMLHDPGHEHLLAIGDAIDIHLDRIVEVAVDEHRVLAGDPHRLPHVAGKLCAVVHDLHGPAAQHIAWPDDDREADALGNRLGLFG